MSKSQCVLNHSRNMSTLGQREQYYLNKEHRKSTSKQRSFFKALWYMFKDNNIDINTECDKRGIKHSVIQDPCGRDGYTVAISYMIEILADHGIYTREYPSQREQVVEEEDWFD